MRLAPSPRTAASPALDLRRKASRLGALCAALGVLVLPRAALAQEADSFTKALERGPFFAGLAAFGGGLLTSLTPCVYPMIVITVSIFGARQATTRRQALLLSSSFVFGIVMLFTPLVVGAALTGSIFGTLLSNRWVIVALVMVFTALAASMFGAFEMVLPESLMQRLSSVGGIGYGGAFLLGLVSGVVAAPCTGPVLTGILLWIGKTQNVFLGAVVGATFAMGLGLPFFLVGAFAISLPKGGKWMLGVKSFFGIAMLVVALHFLQNAFPVVASMAQRGTTFLGLSGGVAVAGLALGAVHLAWEDGGIGVKLRKGLGIAMTVGGLFLFWASVDMPAPRVWEHSEAEALAKAKAEKRPLLVDFTAEWCAACKEFAKETFSDPRVVARTANYVTLKVDATNQEDPQIDQVQSKYKVAGLPTVLIYDSTGAERKRFTGFVAAEPFLAAIQDIN